MGGQEVQHSNRPTAPTHLLAPAHSSPTACSSQALLNAIDSQALLPAPTHSLATPPHLLHAAAKSFRTKPSQHHHQPPSCPHPQRAPHSRSLIAPRPHARSRSLLTHCTQQPSAAERNRQPTLLPATNQLPLPTDLLHAAAKSCWMKPTSPSAAFWRCTMLS